MLQKIISNKIWLIFLIYFAIHVVLLNINYAEWGDSYRILRASEFIRKGTYPEDEKRAPLFSLLMAVRPAGVDQVSWGRFLMLGLSVALMYVFYMFVREFEFGERVEQLSLWLLALNPVFLYWSIRIMADVPFTFLVLLVFYIYKKWEDRFLWWRLLILGFLLGLAVLTRFEGYILGLSLGIGLVSKAFFGDEADQEKKEKVTKLAKTFVYIFIGFIITTLPWFLIRNPFNSTYFEEPGGRIYDFNMVYIYLVSSMYLFGFTSACYFFVRSYKKAKDFLARNVFMTTFLILELFLAFIWPAAIPRLFTPAIPFLVLLFAYLIDQEFSKEEKPKLKEVFILLLLLVFYVVSQLVLKLQFLVLMKTHLFVILCFQFIILYSIIVKKYKLFKIGLILSMLVWSLSTIHIHKDIFKAVVGANKYAVSNLEGKVAYNDVSSVSDWYLNQKSQEDGVNGIYLNMDSKTGRAHSVLEEEKIDYIMITNEHNTDMVFSVDEKDYLEEIVEFRYTIRNKEFFTKIIKFVPYN